jgi:hypothetical protein
MVIKTCEKMPNFIGRSDKLPVMVGIEGYLPKGSTAFGSTSRIVVVSNSTCRFSKLIGGCCGINGYDFCGYT